MHLCTCVNEEGDGGEVAWSETPSLMSYILRYEITDTISLIFNSRFLDS